jgi:hypothetical protein
MGLVHTTVEERVGTRLGRLTCLGLVRRNGTNYQFRWRCDCGREVSRWIGALKQVAYPSCGCWWREVRPKRALKVPCVREHKFKVCGVGMLLKEFSELAGVTRERMRQRFRDHGALEAVARYPAIVAAVRARLEDKSSTGELSEMEAQKSIEELMAAAKKAEMNPTMPARQGKYDGILKELNSKGYGPSAVTRWLKEQGIEVTYCNVATRMNKLGLKMKVAKAS